MHEQLTVSRYFGDYKVNIINSARELSYDKVITTEILAWD